MKAKVTEMKAKVTEINKKKTINIKEKRNQLKIYIDEAKFIGLMLLCVDQISH